MKFLINKSLLPEIINACDNVKCNIDIVMYHFPLPRGNAKDQPKKFIDSLKNAIARGVNIRILLNSGTPADPLRKVNLRTADFFRGLGARVKFWHRGQTMHAKLLLFDKTIAFFGSHNLSKNAFIRNIELSCRIEGSGEIRELQEFYDILWKQI